MPWPEVFVNQLKDNLTSEKYILIGKCEDQPEETESCPKQIDISLTNLKVTFQGSISKSKLEEMALASRLQRTEFCKLTLRALTEMDSAFLYEVNLGSKDATLSWKYLPSPDVKFLLGNATLSAVDQDTALWSVLTGLGNQIKVLIDSNSKLVSEKKKLEEERDSLTQFMEKRVIEKNKMELEMYAKFVRVLNEKKRKNRESTETEDSGVSGASSKLTSTESNIRNNKKSKKLFGINLSDSLEDSIPEPAQVKRKIVKKSNNNQEEETIPKRKLRSPPPPPRTDSSETENDDSDELLEQI